MWYYNNIYSIYVTYHKTMVWLCPALTVISFQEVLCNLHFQIPLRHKETGNCCYRNTLLNITKLAQYILLFREVYNILQRSIFTLVLGFFFYYRFSHFISHSSTQHFCIIRRSILSYKRLPFAYFTSLLVKGQLKSVNGKK